MVIIKHPSLKSKVHAFQELFWWSETNNASGINSMVEGKTNRRQDDLLFSLFISHFSFEPAVVFLHSRMVKMESKIL